MEVPRWLVESSRNGWRSGTSNTTQAVPIFLIQIAGPRHPSSRPREGSRTASPSPVTLTTTSSWRPSFKTATHPTPPGLQEVPSTDGFWQDLTWSREVPPLQVGMAMYRNAIIFFQYFAKCWYKAHCNLPNKQSMVSTSKRIFEFIETLTFQLNSIF